jgi:predicted Zn-dependent protease
LGHNDRRADGHQASEEPLHPETGRGARSRSGCGSPAAVSDLQDERIAHYLTRLVAAAPSELNDPVYEYSFTPVNLKEINAFALLGGPMFVRRGMFDAAASEVEVAGVMAHELSHVLLRHGTADGSKAQNPWLQLGQVAGMVGGAMGVMPEQDAEAFQEAFRRVGESIRLTDAR